MSFKEKAMNIKGVGAIMRFWSSEFNRSATYALLSLALLGGMPFYPVSVLVELPFIVIFSSTLAIHGFKMLDRKGGTKYLVKKGASSQAFTFRKKEEEDEENFTSLSLGVGFIVTLIVIILAFNWKTYDKVTKLKGKMGDLDDMQIEPPQTQHKKKKPPPPKVQKIEEVEDEEVEDEPEIEETEVTEDMAVEAPEPEEEKKEQKIFSVVEDMPSFPGGEQKLLEYIYDHIQYPQMAKENNVEGMVVVKFVVKKDGSIGEIEVLRDIGGGCGEEAKRVVKNMPKWEPGKQRGKAVPVYYKLPIRFTLSN